MNRKSIFLYIPIYLALIIPTPGRFVFGVTIFLEMFFLTIIGTFTNSLVNKLKFERMKTAIILISVIAATIFFRQIFVMICPSVALTLGFVFYLPAVSLFLMGILFNETNAPLIDRLKINLKTVGVFSIIGILFFLIRDIFGYGTFTFFGKNHQIYEKVLFDSDNWAIFSFLGSIPGALIFAGVLFYIAIIIRKKIHIFKNVEINK